MGWLFVVFYRLYTFLYIVDLSAFLASLETSWLHKKVGFYARKLKKHLKLSMILNVFLNLFSVMFASPFVRPFFSILVFKKEHKETRCLLIKKEMPFSGVSYSVFSGLIPQNLSDHMNNAQVKYLSNIHDDFLVSNQKKN